MATNVTIGGETYLKRKPWGIWGLYLLTLGIYYYVWWYKINDEARRYLGDDSIKPTLSVLAFIPGAILLFPALISVWGTASRIRRVREKAGLGAGAPTNWIGLVLSLVASLNMPYYQKHLNEAWERASGSPA